MNISSALISCRVRVNAAPGRTDRLIDNLESLVKALSARTQFHFSYAELFLLADGTEQSWIWMDEERPEVSVNLSGAQVIDLRLNLSAHADRMDDLFEQLLSLTQDGSLADCARICLLREQEEHTRLILSGMHRGQFLHGEVPFSPGCDGLPADLGWHGNPCIQLEFEGDALLDAQDLIDIAQEEGEEIDLVLSTEDSTMWISFVELPSLASVEAFRALLEQLAGLSRGLTLSGEFIPESDSAFALLRFVHEDGRIRIETAIEEI